MSNQERGAKAAEDFAAKKKAQARTLYNKQNELEKALEAYRACMYQAIGFVEVARLNAEKAQFVEMFANHIERTRFGKIRLDYFNACVSVILVARDFDPEFAQEYAEAIKDNMMTDPEKDFVRLTFAEKAMKISTWNVRGE